MLIECADLLIAASATFINCFFTAYAAEILIEIKVSVMAIIKKPNESGIKDPRSFLFNQLIIAINPHTQWH